MKTADWDWDECGGFTSLFESVLDVSGRIIPGNHDSKSGQAFIPHSLFEQERELLDLCDALLSEQHQQDA